MALSFLSDLPVYTWLPPVAEAELPPPVEERTHSVWLDRLFWVAAAGALVGAALIGGFLLAKGVTADMQGMVADMSEQVDGFRHDLQELTSTLAALPEQAGDLMEPLGETIQEAVREGTAEIFPWHWFTINIDGDLRYLL